MMKRVFTFLVLTYSCVVFRSFAQHENTLHLMQSIPQSVYNNPAFVPNYKFTIGLPGISSNYVGFANSGFSYKDVMNKTVNDSTVIDLNKFYDRLGKKNFIRTSVGVDLFSLGFNAGSRLHITFNITQKATARLMYPKELFWVIPGNAPDGKSNTMDMSPKFDFLHYQETGLGGSYIVNQKLTVGARVKMLKGKGNIQTKRSDFTLATDVEKNELTLSGDALVNTSGINRFEEETEEQAYLIGSGDNGIGEVDKNLKDYFFNKKNKGFAIDLGAAYKIMDRLTLGASIVDLGSIKWKDDVKNFTLDGEKNSYTFRGIQLEDEDSFEKLADTIETNLKFNETQNAYRTGLPTKLYINGSYLLLRNCYLGVILLEEIYQKRISSSLSASITKDFGRKLTLSLSYTAANRSYNQIGAGFALKLLPVQLYFVSDNAIGAGVGLQSLKDFNARFGMNLVFGRLKHEDRSTYKKRGI